MSLGYSISCTVDLQHTAENIGIVLRNGSKKFLFEYYLIDYKKLDCAGAKLSVEEAVDALIQGTPDETMSCIIVKYENTHFFFHTLNNSSFLQIMFSGFFNPSVKIYVYSKSENVDIARYVHLMLGLLEDYEILELKVEND